MIRSIKAFLFTIFLLISIPCILMYEGADGPAAFNLAEELFQEANYNEAAAEYWKAIIWHEQTPSHLKYDVQKAFQQFMQCYMVQGRLADGMAFVSLESFRRGQTQMGQTYLQQALQIDPNNEIALNIQREYMNAPAKSLNAAASELGDQDDIDLVGKTPADLYEIAANHFSNKEYEQCADIFEIACARSGYQLGPACANAVYCRTYLLDWGFNGTRFESDMKRIEDITTREAKEYRLTRSDGKAFAWKRATSVHPHMMLGYPVDPTLKRYATEAVAYLDEQMARAGMSTDGQTIPPLPDGMPFQHSVQSYLDEAGSDPNYRIRVGFVGSGFSSKAVLYLSQDMFRFFDEGKYEIHVFSFGAPDSTFFIQHGMDGADWRARVQSNVDFFHDMRSMKDNHIEVARFVHEKGIHILIEWDGYARQGERAQGLFALRPAPIQILHQEYLGTSGALYVDYLFTDKITSPPETQDLYVEKLIYLPNHFFSKGHRFQKEVKPPTYEYLPKESPYRIGTGSPQENRCLAPNGVGPKSPSFVFCNFNKFLKNNPETVRSWIEILRAVPDSMLCLLQYPPEGVDYLRKFVHEAAGTSIDNDPKTFQQGDGKDLNDRIHFLSWEKNPFKHQMRSQDFCNIMLDSYPYNGHTVAQDSLYGGVPIVTRSDGVDMASRVSTSSNVVLGLEHLNAYGGPSDYERAAIDIATNSTLYTTTRTKLIDSCLQKDPVHPYWDVGRYVKNYEAALDQVWQRFLDGNEPDHIVVEESSEAARGTFESDILAHPPMGRKLTN